MERKLFLSLLAVTLLFILTAVTSFIFYEKWSQEKKERVTLQEEVKELTGKLQASESNNKQLAKTGKGFVETMFTYDNKTAPELKNKLLKKVHGKAREKLTAKEKHAHTEGAAALKSKFASSVEIEEALYNRIDEDSAKVTIYFDQIITIEGKETKTKNQMMIDLEHYKGNWSVYDFDMKQLL
jgi:hypothetical protein